MKKNLILLILFVLTSSAFATESNQLNKTACLTVKIDSIRNTKGVIFIDLYSKEDKFPYAPESHFFIRKIVKATGNTVVLKLNDVPVGDYALSIFHDENQNDKIDKNMLGVPQEGYCVSNNVVSQWSAPKFKDALFNFNNDLTMSITMRY